MTSSAEKVIYIYSIDRSTLFFFFLLVSFCFNYNYCVVFTSRAMASFLCPDNFFIFFLSIHLISFIDCANKTTERMSNSSSSKLVTLSQINEEMNDEEFIQLFANIIEHLPLVASSLVHKRPFNSVDHFHQLISTFLDQLPIDGNILNLIFLSSYRMQRLILRNAGKMGVLRLHPDLAGRLAAMNQLTVESQLEQKVQLFSFFLRITNNPPIIINFCNAAIRLLDWIL